MSAGDPVIRDVVAALRDPRSIAALDAKRITDLVARARAGSLLGRIAARAGGTAADALPPRLRAALDAPLTAAEAYHRMARFETDRIRRALAGLDHDIVLLKGSAYVLADLPAARGRSLSDVDILLPSERIGEAERMLREAGWEQGAATSYDEKYFREWMHELPPMRHRERQAVLDLHHTILPLTGRLKPDPKLLLADAVPIAGWPGVRVLAPVDMVLHSVVHHFQDGEFTHSLRELVDLDDLLRHFAARQGFWDGLVTRCEQLGFGRPTFYALRHAERVLGTPVPSHVTQALRRHAPPAPLLALMDTLISTCLLSTGRLPRGMREKTASQALYFRAQWLKMPPGLLAHHAFSKFVNRFRRQPPAQPVKA